MSYKTTVNFIVKRIREDCDFVKLRRFSVSDILCANYGQLMRIERQVMREFTLLIKFTIYTKNSQPNI